MSKLNLITKYSVFLLLGTMFGLMFFSAWNDSGTMDELAHIPSGYSYLTERDYRLNPEHPPLIKDLSAIPLLFLDLKFPTDVPAWTTYKNGQWDMGRIFIYESGNDADKIFKFSRIPVMLLAILFGWMFFRWTRGLYGNKVAFLSLFLFAFSPTFLAHSRYVTTDLAAAFGFFIGISAFLNFLFRQETPQGKKSLVIAGIAFGVAQLLKFSLMLLAPIYIILGILWIFLREYENFKLKKFIKEEFLILWKILLIGVLGILLVWTFYLFHVWQYPIENQVSDATFQLQTLGMRSMANLTVWLSGIPVLRGFGQYLLGLLMVLQRAAGGNTAYFFGEVYNLGWPSYFPLLYLLKEHLALHILTLIALIFGLRNIVKSKEKNFASAVNWLKENFALTASFIFLAIYWIQAITSPLNIGIRHVMPTFPFIYLMVSRQIIRWVRNYSMDAPLTFWEWMKEFYQHYIRPIKRGALVTALLLWMFISTIIAFPHFVSFYNILGGGTSGGYKIAVDSNYDWGQDLYRLKDWTDKNVLPNDKIAIAYFGAGNPGYLFGDKQESWWSSKGSPAEKGIKWFAISATLLQETKAIGIKGFKIDAENKYDWLLEKEPVARAGTSIFIYKF
ncbi:glycosyltransferase family 39 protein [Patescibacteria group bacterium]|nr:glycosyltransferase family 39 protein [Patescibacteria group bacterium]MBU2633584.1 glycosyltransferase family 39 protein [Patescibacteria group bacterium]